MRVAAGPRSTWICIPTFNERDNIDRLLGLIFGVLEHAEVNVVFIDDNSPDGTGALLASRAAADDRIHVIHRSGKQGLATAYESGFEYALSRGAEFVVQMDADLSHDPKELPRLLAAMRTADIAIGSRYVAGGGVTNWGTGRRLLSHIGSFYARRALALPIRDVTGGFKCFRRAALLAVTRQPLTIGGYGFQVEMTYRAARAGLRIAELPITFRERETGVSKMSPKIALEALIRIPQLRISAIAQGRIVPFVGVGLVGAAAGYATLISMVEALGWSPHLAFLLSSIVSFETNFLLNDRFTWRDRQSDSTRMSRRLKSHAGRWMSYPPSQLLFSLLVLRGLNYIAASVAVVALTSLLNYSISDRWVFGRRKNVSHLANAGPADESDSAIDDPPMVTVVIPVRDSAGTLKDTVSSVLGQTYDGSIEVIIVGSPNDSSWEAVRDEIAEGRVIAYEVEVEAAGRDTTVKRTLGFNYASGRVLCSIDSDTCLPTDWISRAVRLVQAGWDGAAGPYCSLDQDYWGNYVDHNRFGSKTPRMDVPYVFDAGTLGRHGHKPPVTGCVVFTAEVYAKVGGFDKDFVYHYDDYDFFQRVAERGFRILCTPELRIGVHHRTNFRALVKEYWESGAGCAQFVQKFPRSRFSTSRVRQLIVVAAGCATAAAFPLYAFDSIVTGAALLGLASGLMDRRWRAAGYPLNTLALGMVFAFAMTFRLIAGVVNRPKTRIGRHRRLLSVHGEVL